MLEAVEVEEVVAGEAGDCSVGCEGVETNPTLANLNRVQLRLTQALFLKLAQLNRVDAEIEPVEAGYPLTRMSERGDDVGTDSFLVFLLIETEN